MYIADDEMKHDQKLLFTMYFTQCLRMYLILED